MRILAIGDVCGRPGLDILASVLPAIKRQQNLDLIIVNGENAAVNGIMPQMADDIFSAGADVITLGNHSFSKKQIFDYLDDHPFIIRPLNFPPQRPGQGHTLLECCGKQVCVINLIGRASMNDFTMNNPFTEVDKLLKSTDADIYIVDFHAEMTSEKKAMGYFLDGRASAVYGTHTHVQTSDERILPCGTGYITDIGMTGSAESVIGIKPELSIAWFRGDIRPSFESATEDLRVQGAIFELDDSGKCVSVTRVDETD